MEAPQTHPPPFRQDWCLCPVAQVVWGVTWRMKPSSLPCEDTSYHWHFNVYFIYMSYLGPYEIWKKGLSIMDVCKDGEEVGSDMDNCGQRGRKGPYRRLQASILRVIVLVCFAGVLYGWCLSIKLFIFSICTIRATDWLDIRDHPLITSIQRGGVRLGGTNVDGGGVSSMWTSTETIRAHCGCHKWMNPGSHQLQLPSADVCGNQSNIQWTVNRIFNIYYFFQ